VAKTRSRSCFLISDGEVRPVREIKTVKGGEHIALNRGNYKRSLRAEIKAMIGKLKQTERMDDEKEGKRPPSSVYISRAIRG